MKAFAISDERLTQILRQNKEWGDVKVPESLASGLTHEQVRDLNIILTDRRITDLSAQFWMKKKEGPLVCVYDESRPGMFMNEFPWTAKLKGVDIEGSGATEEEAISSLVEMINDNIKCVNGVKAAISKTVGPL